MGKSDDDREKKTKDFTRRDFLKAAGGTVAMTAIPSLLQLSAQAQESGQTQVTWDGAHAVSPHDPSKPNVYFTRELSPAGVRKIYERINKRITGRVGIKLHTGEPHGPNLLPIESLRACRARFRAAQSLSAMYFIKARAEKLRHTVKQLRSMALAFVQSIFWMKMEMSCYRYQA